MCCEIGRHGNFVNSCLSQDDWKDDCRIHGVTGILLRYWRCFSASLWKASGRTETQDCLRCHKKIQCHFVTDNILELLACIAPYNHFRKSIFFHWFCVIKLINLIVYGFEQLWKSDGFNVTKMYLLYPCGVPLLRCRLW